jgi:predicted O-methyltransferase YrrM
MIDRVARLTGFEGWEPQGDFKPALEFNEGELEAGAPRIDFNAKSLYDLVSKEYSEGIFVEVGAWVGRSTAYLASVISPAIKLYVVDTWQGSFGQDPQSEKAYRSLLQKNEGDVFRVFLENMTRWGYIHAMTPLRMRSLQAARLFRDDSLTFCFVDAGHDYASVKQDLTAWFPKLRPGGVIGGDDYGVDWPGVDRAVNEFFAPLGKISSVGRCWYSRKSQHKRDTCPTQVS